MFVARRSYTAWLLRLAAFVLFISGGALAQRYLSTPSAMQSLPLEGRDHDVQAVVILETTRKIEFADSLADAVPPVIVPFAVQIEDAQFESRVEIVQVAVSATRAFDALAPPRAH